MTRKAWVHLSDLSGRVALVTGAAGAIGRACAERLQECGATVFGLDRVTDHLPTGVTPLAIDLGEPDAVTRALMALQTTAGHLDILVHAAGVTTQARVWKTTDTEWDRVIETNLTASFRLIREAVPLMRNAGGAMVFISSINGTRGKVGLSAYAASKAGVDALVRTTAREVGAFGIRVNAVAPGWIDTPMTAAATPDARAAALADTALGRLGTPDEVARVVVVLASDLARHVTGQIVRVDGGQLIG